jgi:hypothetical protein
VNPYLDAVAGLYGRNWAAEGERRVFVVGLSRVADAQFLWTAERPPAPRALSVTGLRVHAEAIEQDFQRFTYRLRALELGEDRLLARGELEAIGRASRQPLAPPFAHRWVLVGHGVLRVEGP